MTAHRLIYLAGPPGAGKSTLMARLTEGFARLPDAQRVPPYPVAHDVLFDKHTGEVVGAEIGRRRELFSGTDALPSSIIERAIPWVATRPYPLLLAEGARLANARFLKAASAAGYDVILALLDHPDAETWRRQRVKLIGRDQNPSWVAGRVTASRNLADSMAEYVEIDGRRPIVVRGGPDVVYPDLAAVISMSLPSTNDA